MLDVLREIGIRLVAFLPGICALLSFSRRASGENPERAPELLERLDAAGITPDALAAYDRSTHRAGTVGGIAYSIAFVLVLIIPALGLWAFLGAWSLMHLVEFRIRRRFSEVMRVEWEYPWPDLHHPLGTARGALIWAIVSGLVFAVGIVLVANKLLHLRLLEP